MKKIYFIGINGIGMSGLAKIMHSKGYEVYGSDVKDGRAELKELGIQVNVGQVAQNIMGQNFDLVVISTAIRDDNPEYQYAKEQNFKIIRRGELLAHLMEDTTSIAVSGTHGKTTTSSMMGAVLGCLDPTIVVGGILPEIKSNACCGKSKYFVAEADESDNSFLYMHPTYSVITNIEEDHLEHHGNLENIIKSFSQFIEQTKTQVLTCIDCPITKRLIEQKKSEKIITYSIHNKADIYAKNITVKENKTFYDVYIKDELIGDFTLSIPGIHNVQNSLPVIYLAVHFGLSLDEIKEKIINFKGSRRRYDILYDKDIKIIDDYAHHPTEVVATLQGAKSIEDRKITIIFQPHRYSRVKFLLNGFKDAFNMADEVILMPIYSAGEDDSFGVNIVDLKDNLNCDAKIMDKDEIENKIIDEKDKKVFLFMGAGDISALAHKIANRVKDNADN